MSIFGNGVISGWRVSAEESFAVSISEGYGNINFTAARTNFPDVIENIAPNSINYVYAKIRERTTFAEDVEFILSPTRNLNDLGSLLLAEVIAGAASIENIDNTIRQSIGFIELIKAAIRLHRHRGGSLNPSKIDLESEVKGQLPSFRIADFDADKVTTGTFDLARMPLLDHQDLQNVGLLTHPQLDTFVKTLEASNKELFGEIGTSNLLQLILAMKFIYDDPESSFYLTGRTVDENMINELSVIPGITPNTYIDFDNTTADVDLEQHYIRGIPPITGTSFYVRYNTDLAWRSAHTLTNIVIVGDTATLSFDSDEESNVITIEGFESATAPGQSLSGGSGGQSIFTKETILLSDNADIVANSTSTNVIEGFYSGKFAHQQSFRQQFVKTFAEPQDWSTYDSFVLHTKCLNAVHGSVNLYFEDSSGGRSIVYTILEQNEVTDNSDPASNNFEMRVIDLSTVAFTDDIKKFVIYTDDLDNPFNFYIDFINIQRAILLPESGTMVLRFASSTNVTFSSIDWTSIEPTGTNITVRARAANGTAFLTRAEYTPYLSNGDFINLEGTDIEIEIVMTPDSDRLSAPVLIQVRILILSEAEIDGFVIDSVNEYSRGDASNVLINSSPTSLSLTTPIQVDSYCFALSNNINQIVERTASGNRKFTVSELSLSGINTPIAPNQVFRAVEKDISTVNVGTLFAPRSARRQIDKTFVIADTYNDRILQLDEDGEVIAGVGSINYSHSSKIFPIAAAVDTRSSILYVVWSKRISFKTVNVSKITLKTSTQQTIQLVRDFDKIMGLSTSELDQVDAEGQIMPVYLSLQSAGLLASFPTTGAFMLASSDVISTGLNTDSVFYKKIVTVNGIPLYVGNFAYIDGIFTPTFADKTDEGGFVVANGTIGVKEYSFPSGISESIALDSSVSSIIEIDRNNNIIFGNNSVLFSPFVPGRADKIDSRTMLLAGLKPTGEPGSSDALTFRSISGSSEEKSTQKSVLNDIFFGGSPPFVGAVIVLDTQARATIFEYISPEGILVSDVDVDSRDGSYVVAESSLERSGRIIKLDATGNITFSFGEGVYGLINSISVTTDGSIIIST